MTTQGAGQQPPAFLNEIERQPASADRLTQIKAKVAELRDKAQELADLEARVETVKAEKLTLETVTLPDMLAAVGMDNFGLEAEGNNPAYDLKIEPLVRANIAAGWDEAKRQAGFEVLRQLNGESLIKTVVTFEFDPKERAAAKEFVERVFDELGYEGKEALSVNHNSMASWLKAEVNANPPRVPSPAQLQAIGGFVGKTAKIKKRREN
jgi:hypothetical protein